MMGTDDVGSAILRAIRRAVQKEWPRIETSLHTDVDLDYEHPIRLVARRPRSKTTFEFTVIGSTFSAGAFSSANPTSNYASFDLIDPTTDPVAISLEFIRKGTETLTPRVSCR